MGINPRLSDLKGPGTSQLDWRYLEHNKIDRNELQICTNSQKGTGTKIAEKLNNFEKFERKKKKSNSALFLTQRPPDAWPDALDHLAIGSIADKCTNLARISKILLLSLGLSTMKIPLCEVLLADVYIVRLTLFVSSFLCDVLNLLINGFFSEACLGKSR